MAPRYSQKRFSIWRPSVILILKNCDFFLSNIHLRNENVHLCTEFARNRRIHDWAMEIKLFSKWRPSVIFNLQKLQFWSRNLYLHEFLQLWSNFRINRPIWRQDIAKKRFSIWRPSVILILEKFRFFFQISIFGMKMCICVPNFPEIG